MTSLWQLTRVQLHREALILVRSPRILINSALFFLMVVVFFPLSMPADKFLLRQIAPGLSWIAILLTCLSAAQHLFSEEGEEGVIEQWLSSGLPLGWLVVAKLLTHWCFYTIIWLFFCPLLALLFHLQAYEMVVLMLTVVAGTPAMFLLTGLAAVFGGGAQQQGAFLALILLPLTLPIMILASGCVAMAMQGVPVSAYLALLGALSLVSLALLPMAIGAVLRVSL